MSAKAQAEIESLATGDELEITSEISAAHEAGGEVMVSEIGDVIEIDGDEQVIVDRSSTRITVENTDGGQRTTYVRRKHGVTEIYDYHGDTVTVERTGQRICNGESLTPVGVNRQNTYQTHGYRQ